MNSDRWRLILFIISSRPLVGGRCARRTIGTIGTIRRLLIPNGFQPFYSKKSRTGKVTVGALGKPVMKTIARTLERTVRRAVSRTRISLVEESFELFL
jgi:hypothetical protein